VISAWLALAGALLATAHGQLMYKLYFRSKRVYHLALSVGFFLAAPVCAYLALRTLNIGTVYMSTAITQVMVMALSHFVLGERLTMDHFIAIVLIVSGVTMYAYPGYA